MPESNPPPISAQERQKRIERIRRLAKQFGFEGTVEYRHVWSGTGGAQYTIGTGREKDGLAVFAEAFERDADPEDFSLDAILAHERGHQLLVRHPRLAPMAKKISIASDEILASLIGSLIAAADKDRQVLYYKALFEAVTRGVDLPKAARLCHELCALLEQLI
jgi:hypothetical protein